MGYADSVFYFPTWNDFYYGRGHQQLWMQRL